MINKKLYLEFKEKYPDKSEDEINSMIDLENYKSIEQLEPLQTLWKEIEESLSKFTQENLCPSIEKIAEDIEKYLNDLGKMNILNFNPVIQLEKSAKGIDATVKVVPGTLLTMTPTNFPDNPSVIYLTSLNEGALSNPTKIKIGPDTITLTYNENK